VNAAWHMKCWMVFFSFRLQCVYLVPFSPLWCFNSSDKLSIAPVVQSCSRHVQNNVKSRLNALCLPASKNPLLSWNPATVAWKSTTTLVHIMASWMMGRGYRRWMAYVLPFLLLVIIYQMWNKPCHVNPFGEQVRDSFSLWLVARKCK